MRTLEIGRIRLGVVDAARLKSDAAQKQTARLPSGTVNQPGMRAGRLFEETLKQRVGFFVFFTGSRNLGGRALKVGVGVGLVQGLGYHILYFRQSPTTKEPEFGSLVA